MSEKRSEPDVRCWRTPGQARWAGAISDDLVPPVTIYIEEALSRQTHCAVVFTSCLVVPPHEGDARRPRLSLVFLEDCCLLPENRGGSGAKPVPNRLRW